MNKVHILRIEKDIPVAAFTDAAWARASPVRVNNFWSGEPAPESRAFEVRLLWSDSSFYVRFDAEQHESLVINERPDVSKKTRGLWDRDVCEIFIAPDRTTPTKYFEFEIAPTGEWIDLAIEFLNGERVTDWEYASEMESAAAVETNRVKEVLKIPLASLGRSPQAGDVWLGNLFRCVGEGPGRGYLAWCPTGTPEPAFHVPSAFGEFEFSD